MKLHPSHLNGRPCVLMRRPALVQESILGRGVRSTTFGFHTFSAPFDKKARSDTPLLSAGPAAGDGGEGRAAQH